MSGLQYINNKQLTDDYDPRLFSRPLCCHSFCPCLRKGVSRVWTVPSNEHIWDDCHEILSPVYDTTPMILNAVQPFITKREVSRWNHDKYKIITPYLTGTPHLFGNRRDKVKRQMF